MDLGFNNSAQYTDTNFFKSQFYKWFFCDFIILTKMSSPLADSSTPTKPVPYIALIGNAFHQPKIVTLLSSNAAAIPPASAIFG